MIVFNAGGALDLDDVLCICAGNLLQDVSTGMGAITGVDGSRFKNDAMPGLYKGFGFGGAGCRIKIGCPYLNTIRETPLGPIPDLSPSFE